MTGGSSERQATVTRLQQMADTTLLSVRLGTAAGLCGVKRRWQLSGLITIKVVNELLPEACWTAGFSGAAAAGTPGPSSPSSVSGLASGF